ncbi:MAG: type III pantothenate kinase [Oscillospiraceae bacterium]|nr:type III pantothenate kinase [Oscillospiraceae bacterium]
MLFVADIGNTQVTMGLYRGGDLVFVSRMATEPDHTRDQYAVAFRNILSLYGYAPKDIAGAAISSVVPSAGHSVCRAIEFLCGFTPLTVGAGTETGLTIKIDNPTQLGADLLVGAVAAVAKYPMPAAVFDFGTATKVSVLDADGAFLGCAIAAGIRMSIEALSKNTAALPPIVARPPCRVIGANTVDSMRSGVLLGSAAFIDGMAERIEAELGRPVTIVVTGGLSPLLRGQTRREAIFDETLLLDGLRRIYDRHIGEAP